MKKNQVKIEAATDKISVSIVGRCGTMYGSRPRGPKYLFPETAVLSRKQAIKLALNLIKVAQQ